MLNRDKTVFLKRIFKNNNQEIFSIVGIKIAVEHFWKLGCRKITVFLPPSRRSNKGMPRIPERELKLQRKMEELDIIKVTFKILKKSKKISLV